MNIHTVTGQNTNDAITEAMQAESVRIDRKEYIEVVPNVKLHVRDWGTGKPIVFIHGWPFSNEIFEYQFATLPQQGFRCIAITLRGFGKSDQPYSNYTYDLLANDVHKVLSILEIENVLLVGYSIMGAAVATRYMTLHLQARVNKLVLISAPAPGIIKRENFPTGTTLTNIDNMASLCIKDRAQLINSFCEQIFISENKISLPFINWLNMLGMQASPYATLQALLLMQDTGFQNNFSLITVPTAILHSTNDKICSLEIARYLNSEIRNSQLTLFDNCGHALLLEERKKCNKILIESANQ